jgi:hypothetical protein
MCNKKFFQIFQGSHPGSTEHFTGIHPQRSKNPLGKLFNFARSQFRESNVQVLPHESSGLTGKPETQPP